MYSQQLTYRDSEQSHEAIAQKMVLISNKKVEAVQLFELFSQFNIDICYIRHSDESLISAVKPQFIVFQIDLCLADGEAQRLAQRVQESLVDLQSFNIPVILLMDESVYLSVAPIDLTQVHPFIWPSKDDTLLTDIHRIVEDHKRFSKFEDGIVFKDLLIDTKRMIVKKNNQRIDLTKTEYDLLNYFIKSEGIVQTREALLEHIWNLQYFEGSNIVDVHIKSLRRKLNDSAVDPQYILTVRGVGYRLADI